MRKSLSTFIVTCISLLLVTGSLGTVHAVTYPVGVPTGEVAGGTFNTYFSNMFGSGIIDVVLDYTKGCPSGQVMRGLSNTGILLCVSPGLNVTSSSTLALSGALIGTPNYIAKYTPTGTGINNSQIYDNGANVGIANISPAYKLDVAGTGSFYGLRVASGAMNGYVLTSDAAGIATWQIAPTPCVPGGTGLNNTCYGINALVNNTTGANNTANGMSALGSNTTGNQNTAIGYQSLFSNGIGLNNTAIGNLALGSNTMGSNNSAIGNRALNANVAGIDNLANGFYSLYFNINGSANVGLGSLTLFNSTGNNNTAVGYNAGNNLTAGDNNTAVGYNTNFISTTGSNQLNIANIIFGTGLTGTVGAPVGNVGIGTASPTAKLEVAGQIKITGGAPGIGKTLISDASGLATWTDTVSGSTATGIVSGAGNQNYLAKFGSGGVGIYSSQLYDDGTNMGIGTITPGAKLEVAGQIKITGGTPGVNKVLSSDAAGLATWVSLSSVSGVWSLLGNSGTVAGTNFLGTTDNQALVFKTNNTEAMRLLTSGNLGIGTAAPGAKLEVAGQVKITGGVPGAGKVLTSDAVGMAIWATPASGYPCVPGGSMPLNTCYGSGSLFSILNGNKNAGYGAYSLFSLQNGDNNTGIGHEALYTNRNGNNNTAVGYQASYLVNNPAANNTSIGYLAGYNVTTGNNNISVGANTNLLNPTGDNQMNIGNAIFGINMNGSVGAPAGNIGIGTNNPTAKLEVAGQVKIAATGAYLDYRPNAVSCTNGQILSWNNASTRWECSSNAPGISGSGLTTNYVTKWNGTNIANSQIFDNGTNIGIGTAIPGYKFVIDNGASANRSLVLKNSVSDGSNLSFNSIANNMWSIDQLGFPDARLRFFSELGSNGSQEWMTILENGNLGIGTTTPGSKLEVAGNSYFNGNVTVSGSLIVDKIVNRTVNNVSISGSLLPDSLTPLVYRDIGSAAQRWNNLYLSGQVTIAGGTPGAGKVLTSDAAGLATWVATGLPCTPGGTGIGNSCYGAFALVANGTGTLNTANGQFALTTNTIGSSNTANGYQALRVNTTGSFNTANGMNSLGSNTTGVSNIANGYQSLYSNTTGGFNTAGGRDSLYSNTTGGSNVAYGYQSLYFNSTGSNNTAIGSNALYTKTTGSNNTAIGANTDVASSIGSNQLNIGNAIFGVGLNGSVGAPAGNIGIGITNPTTKLEVAGQIKITGGTPGVGKILVSDATGLASWTGVVTATGLNVGGAVLGSTLFYNGTAWTAGTGIYNTGGNIGIGTASPTSKLTIDSGTNGSGGLRLARITSTSTPYAGANIGLGVDGSGNIVPVSNGDVVVYLAKGRSGVQPTPDPDLPNRLIGYNFNTYFAIPTSQSFVVSDGNGAGYNAPYFKENGTSGICSGGGSPYDCAVADPFTGLSASPNNSFTMTAKGSVYGYQMALGARGDAPLFARSGKFVGAQTGGLYLSDNVTPTPWQKVLTVPANHIEYFYVNIGYNSQLQAIAGGGNVGIGTSIPDRRLVISGSGTTTSATQQVQIRRGVQGADASLGNTYGTPYMNIGGQENRVNSLQTIGFGKSLLGAAGYAPAEIGFLTTSVAGNTQGDIVFANRNGTTNVVPTEVMRIESTGDVGIGVSNPTQQLQISRSMSIPATASASTGVIYKGAARFLHNYTASAFTPNLFLGLNAGNFTMTQGYNIGIGDSALALNTTGFSNMALGYLALSNNTTGGNNAAIGSEALELNQTGNNNVANGFKSLYANLTGGNNTSIGTEALTANNIGSNNTANGYQALNANTSGNSNTAIGGQSLFTNVSGQFNTAVGYQALRVANSPSSNTAIGYQAGNAITTGASNIVIGANAQVGSPTGSNQLSIGNWLYGSGGNIGIGIAAPTAKLEVAGNFKLGANGTITTAAGVCTIASTTITTTPTTYTCTGIPASTNIAVNCSGTAAFSSSAISLYCRATGILNQVACNTSMSLSENTTAMTYKCMWMQ